MPTITGLDHFVLTVADISVTVAFYTGVLGMREEVFRPADGSIRTALAFGNQKINLHQAGREFDPKATHPAAGSADFCLLTETPPDIWQGHLRALDIPIIEGPVKRTGARGVIESLYIRDPDGNLVEISRYS